jgi:photosystem II stability/assembly factor-like uncharacterized protein
MSSDGRSALAVGDAGTILYSLDGGGNWAPATSSSTRTNLVSAALSPDGRTALVVGPEDTIRRSADGGTTWSPTNLSVAESLFSIALSPDGKAALAVGPVGTILRSTDGGAAWLPVTSGSRAYLRSVDVSATGRVALVVAPGTILRSQDGGATWSPVISGLGGVLWSVALSADGRVALAVVFGTTILRSTDGGTNWSSPTSGKANLGSVALSADGRSAVAVGPSGTIRRSADGGANWSSVNSGTAANLNSIALSRNGRSAVAVGDGGTILDSLDGGENWAPSISGTEEPLFSVALSADGKVALAVGRGTGGHGGTILRRADGGATWSPVALGIPDMPSSVALSAEGNVALMPGNVMLRSTDGGINWSPVTIGTTVPLLTSAALSPDGSAALTVGFHSTVLRSADSGATWRSVEPPHRAPPRLAWLFWAGGIFFLLPAFVALRPIKPLPRNIAELLVTDRPLQKGDLDATGQADRLAAQIGRFLRNARTEPPLTIAITGPWGSGKSSVLSRLRDDLVLGKQRPVWFNAWHRQGEESMFAALLQSVRDEAVPSWWLPAGVDVRARLLLSRIRGKPLKWLPTLLVIALVIGFLAAAPWPKPTEALAPLHDLVKEEKFGEAGLKLLLALGWWPLPILLSIVFIMAALRDRLSSAGLNPGRLLAAAGRATRWRDLGVQLAFRDRFKQVLSEVTAALGRRTLTILIDDLDRCRPDQIAEVLEAISFLTDTHGCFVAFGFVREQVLAGIGLANREIAAELAGAEDRAETRKSYAEQYLRKMIQLQRPCGETAR